MNNTRDHGARVSSCCVELDKVVDNTEGNTADNTDSEFDWLGFVLDSSLLHSDDLVLLKDGPSGYWNDEEVPDLSGESREALLLHLKNSDSHSLPCTLRTDIWLYVSHREEFVFSQSEALLDKRWEEYKQLSEDSAIKSQIILDIERTFPEHQWLEFDMNVCLLALERILASASLDFTGGYCQSMNFVAYFLLVSFLFHDKPKTQNREDFSWLQDPHIIHDAEVKSFYVFESILSIAGEYHAKTLLRTISDTKALEILIRDYLPTVHDHFQTLGGAVNVALFATPWFMTLYCTILSSLNITFVWDWILVEQKIDILFCAALSILEYSQEKLLKHDNTFECTSILKENLHLIPHKEFINSTMKFKALLSSEALEKIRCHTYNEQKRELGEIQIRRDIHAMMSSIPFSRGTLYHLKDRFIELSNQEMALEYNSFKKLLHRLPALAGNEDMLDVFCNAFDSNGDGLIEFKEFAAGLSTIFQGSTDERLRLCFDCYDKDKSGFIDREELQTMISMIYQLFYSHIPLDLEEKVDNIMDNLDAFPRDNKLSFEEFRGVVAIEPMILRCFMPPNQPSEPQTSVNHSLELIRIVSQIEKTPLHYVSSQYSLNEEFDFPGSSPPPDGVNPDCFCSLL